MIVTMTNGQTYYPVSRLYNIDNAIELANLISNPDPNKRITHLITDTNAIIMTSQIVCIEDSDTLGR